MCAPSAKHTAWTAHIMKSYMRDKTLGGASVVQLGCVDAEHADAKLHRRRVAVRGGDELRRVAQGERFRGYRSAGTRATETLESLTRPVD